MDDKQFFSKNLLAWHRDHHRPMPWKGERDPYKIWLSEIILQQTRVEQGLPYYEKFLAAYPTVRRLADAPLDAVLKNWEGLGYYSRARNLHTAARYIANALGGAFPDHYDGIRALKGVGDYTAAAIASFAYDLPYAVLDGNVYRVLARFFGIDTPIDSTPAKKEFAALAQSLLDVRAPGAYNQAIMDFGAGHCAPRQPACTDCPLGPRCVARQSGQVAQLPVRKKAMAKRVRFFAYGVFEHRNTVWLRRRDGKDIWQQLYEFPLLELPETPADTATLPPLLVRHFFPAGLPEGLEVQAVSKTYRQTLSHQIIQAVFIEFKMPDDLKAVDFQKTRLAEYAQIEQFKLKKILAVPRIIDWYWQEKALTLRLV
ncbi:MAG: A/G-specific adenine glycosylase [Saprospiraceae bacterium]